MVWMNERRDVRFYQLYQEAKRMVRGADSNAPSEDLNFSLVHATGRATTPVQVGDPSFGLYR